MNHHILHAFSSFLMCTRVHRNTWFLFRYVATSTNLHCLSKNGTECWLDGQVSWFCFRMRHDGQPAPQPGGSSGIVSAQRSTVPGTNNEEYFEPGVKIQRIWNFTRNTQLLCVLPCCSAETKAVIYRNTLPFAARKDWHDTWEDMKDLQHKSLTCSPVLSPSIPQWVRMDCCACLGVGTVSHVRPSSRQRCAQEPAWNQGFWDVELEHSPFRSLWSSIGLVWIHSSASA